MKSILVVDDSQVMRDVVRMTLSSSKLNILSAINGEEGLSIYSKNKEDICLVITDINMPIMNGIEFISCLREEDKQVPVLVLTTESCEEMKKKMIKLGASGWVTKPFKPKSFTDIVAKII
jgi:two-component system chemotaxis response regulator CheY